MPKLLLSTLTKHKMLLSNLSVENNHDDCFFFFLVFEKFGTIFRVSISMSILAIRGKRRQETVKMPKYDLILGLSLYQVTF